MGFLALRHVESHRQRLAELADALAQAFEARSDKLEERERFTRKGLGGRRHPDARSGTMEKTKKRKKKGNKGRGGQKKRRRIAN